MCLNGRDLGTRFMKPYVFAVPPGALRAKGNVLDVEVTNTGSNRLRDLDRRGVAWKIFTDINMVSKDYKPLDASKYPFEAAGLLGPVTLETGAEEKDAAATWSARTTSASRASSGASGCGPNTRRTWRTSRS